MRDQWYAICEQRYKDANVVFYVDKTEKLYQVKSSREINEEEALKFMQDSLSELLTHAAESIKTDRNFEAVASTADYVGTATSIAGTLHSSEYCPRCHSYFAFPTTTGKCPICRNPLRTS